MRRALAWAARREAIIAEVRTFRSYVQAHELPVDVEETGEGLGPRGIGTKLVRLLRARAAGVERIAHSRPTSVQSTRGA